VQLGFTTDQDIVQQMLRARAGKAANNLGVYI
jgi:hypothetical protein